MPIYTFRLSKRHKKIYQIELPYQKIDAFFKDNPEFVQEFQMNIGDPMLLDGVMKVPSDFSKYILGRVKNKVPGATIERGRYHVQKEI